MERCHHPANEWLWSLLAVTPMLLSLLQAVAEPETLSNNTATLSLDLPSHSIFQQPWVKQNVAFTYAHRYQDGIGSQTVRMVAVYALAETLGVQHLFRPLRCVGHIGNSINYRHRNCTFKTEADRRLLERAQQLVALPSTIAESDAADWHQKVVTYFDWGQLVKEVTAALQKQQPTIFAFERLHKLVLEHPDVFMTIAALRPSQPPPPLTCQRRRIQADRIYPLHKDPWLLDAARVAIHIRRGDVANWERRALDASYYINIARSISKVLDESGCSHSVEVHIESPSNPQQTAEVKHLCLSFCV